MALQTGSRTPARRTAVVLGVGLILGLLGGVLAGCGGAQTSADHGVTHVMPDGTRMSDAQMQSMGGMAGMDDSSGSTPAPESSGAGTARTADARAAEDQPAPGRVAHFASGPSAAAAMICSKETADAVRRNFALPTDARASDAWKAPTYTCDYALPHGTLHLAVRDLRAGADATAWFQRTRARTSGAHRIKGLQSLGLPAFEASGGQVGFLKDGRTLVVDAGDVARQDLPPGYTRTGIAYGVASAVIACWSE